MSNVLDSRTDDFILEVMLEVSRARKKFPETAMTMAALVEEVGELAQAILDKPASEVWAEAVQVACMAVRVATEGDSSASAYRSSKLLDELGASR